MKRANELSQTRCHNRRLLMKSVSGYSRRAAGPLWRMAILAVGWMALGLGIAGIFLPLLPTTPFLLLAAWCFFRSSPRLYDRLLTHPQLGPYIRNFREYRAIPLRVKVLSVVLIWATLLYCVFAVAAGLVWGQVLLLALAITLTWHILSYKTLHK